MLENIRENSSGVIAWGIAILIIITMAFFGVSSYVSQEPIPTVASVGKQSITQYSFRNALQAQQQQMRRFMGDNVSIDLNSDDFKKNVLDNLINRALLEETAEKDNYQVNDALLGNLIRENRQFQVDGKFSLETYNDYVASRGQSKAQFENDFRQRARLQQVASGFAESSFVPAGRLDDLLALRTEKRSFDLVKFSTSDYLTSVEVSDSETDAYYQANIADFNEPEKVSVEYIRLNTDDLKSQVTVTDEELLSVYEQDNASYIDQEKRQTRHILFTGDDSLEQAQTAAERLNSGDDFAALATELSQDPGSAQNGGDLGVIEKGIMVKAFDDRAFSLQENEISEPVKTEYGHHLIQVTSIDRPEPKPFDEVKAEIEQQELSRKAEDLFFERAEDLRNLVYENSDSLQVAADELGLTVQTTPLFSRDNGQGVASNAVVREAAFGETVLSEGINSEVLELSATDFIAIRKQEFVESKPKSLDSVKAQIDTILKQEKASAKAAELAEAAYERLLSANDWSATVEALKLQSEAQIHSSVDNASDLDPVLVEQVFAASTKDFPASVGKVSDAIGDYYLFKFNGVIDAVETEVTEQLKDSTRQIASRRDGSEVVNKFLESKRESMDVEIDYSLL